MSKLKFFGFLVGVFSLFSVSTFSTCAFKVEARHVSNQQAYVGEEREIITLRMGKSSSNVIANGPTVEVAKRLLCGIAFKIIKEELGIDLHKYLVHDHVPMYAEDNLNNKFKLVFSFPKDDVKLFNISSKILKCFAEKFLNKDGSASEKLKKEVGNVIRLVNNEKSFGKIIKSVLKVYRRNGIKKPRVSKEGVLEVIYAVITIGINEIEKHTV